MPRGPSNDHINLPTAAARTDQPLAPIEQCCSAPSLRNALVCRENVYAQAEEKSTTMAAAAIMLIMLSLLLLRKTPMLASFCIGRFGERISG